MATLASTNVSSSLPVNGEEPLAFGGAGMLIEVFRCAGGAVGDTVALTPKYIKKIKTVISNQSASSNASTSGTTNVTLTLTASAATSVTFDAFVIGNRDS